MTAQHSVDVIYQAQTAKAVCIRQVEDSPDIWIPKSQCQISAYGLLANSPPERNCVVKLTAPEQILTDRGLL